MNMFDLSGKTAVVTGGNSGIGFAIATGLASHGAQVVIVNRRIPQGKLAAERLVAQGFSADSEQADVSVEASVDQLVKAVLKKHGQIDILVNSAAAIVRKPAVDVTAEEFDLVMSNNVRGTFLCCRNVGRHMIERRKGKVINLSSNVSQVVQENRSAYCVSKAAVSHLTRALAAEWAQYGVNVNAIGPGPTITEFNTTYFEEHPEDRKKLTGLIPMGRMGAPADCAGAAIFLASDASDFVTGQTLLVDGGSTLL
ncbi:MAG: glucose 1-dehydrogenase [Dehalococcoidia bacterium]|nr:glucose 1-dehydrogenase [Dehalococcoidia bacterium]